MKRVEVWKSDHGTFETDLARAKAYDIVAAMNKAISDKHVYGQTPKSRIDLSEALELVENADLVIKHLQEYLKVKDQTDVEAEAPPEGGPGASSSDQPRSPSRPRKKTRLQKPRDVGQENN